MIRAKNRTKKSNFAWLPISALLLLGLTGCPGPSTTKVESDIIVTDPSSMKADWLDAREAMVKRIRYAFGQTLVDGGGKVGKGTDGYIVAIPVGSFTDITSKIDVLDHDEIVNFKDYVIGKNNSSRASTIYRQLLSGDNADSFWSYLVDTQLKDAEAASNFNFDSCENYATARLAQASDGSQMRRALNYSATTADLPRQSCTLLEHISSSIHDLDQAMSVPGATCAAKTADGRMPCSDVKGSVRAINRILSDVKDLESDDEGAVKTQTGACIMFASDMINYNVDGPLPEWQDGENGSEGVKAASQAGAADAISLLPEGFPRLEQGINVYMPNAGAGRTSAGRSEQRTREIIAYWEAFFDSLGAKIKDGTADDACTGKEFKS